MFLLCGMSAAESGTDQQGDGPPYLIKLLFCRPRRGVPLLFTMPGTCPRLCPRHCGRRDGPYIHPTYIYMHKA